MPKASEKAEDYIVPLNINGLEGRMLRAPSTRKRRREILFIYGHHAMIERWWSYVENLRPYGNVTMPDLPGFGGMESFYKIDTRPTVDAFADYLAAFIKLRYKNKRVTIFGVSYGFVVVTRMLQRYPELAKKVDLLVSVIGFMHSDDFHWSRQRRYFFRKFTRLVATRPVAIFVRYVCLNRFVIKTLTENLPHSKHRFITTTPEEFEASMDLEVTLWHVNDVRTHWLTTSEFFHLDNTKKQIALPVVHVISQGDHYFNNIAVEQHMRRVFQDYIPFVVNFNAHTPHITADKKTMAIFLPAGVRKLLNQKSK